jgi:hypothetical protein
MRNITVVLLLAGLAAGCGDGGGQQLPDAGGEPDAYNPPCVTNPKTHEEILNACVKADVEKIDKRPVLPLMGSDGTLPVLP